MLALLGVSLSLGLPASADEPILTRESRLHQGLPWNFCGPRDWTSSRGMQIAIELPDYSDLPIELIANSVDYLQTTGIIFATGAAQVIQGGQRLEAPALTYERDSERLTSSGETLIESDGLRMIGEDASFHMGAFKGDMSEVHYRVSEDSNLRGRADRAEMLNRLHTRFDRVSYTSCPPGNNAWSLRAKKLSLDRDKNQGIARDATLRLGPVPVFYTPYFSFPLSNERKSGFLRPTIGSSETTGFDLTLPYYWNIKPNWDATFYPRYMEERGLLLGTEVRTLQPNGSARLFTEIIPDDKGYARDAARGLLRLEQQGNYFGPLSTRIDFNAVTDDTYFEDFGNDLDLTSTRRLTRFAEAVYRATDWTLTTRIQAFQALDKNDPYERLPQIRYSLRKQTLGPGLEFQFDGEYNYFYKKDAVHGQRLTLSPSLSWPLRKSYGHLIPTARLHASKYLLEETSAGDTDSPDHLIPSFDLDAKLIFERPINWLGQSGVQTLEPRIKYLYTPFVDQSDTPVFDSSQLGFQFAYLFRDNRFTGGDRIGDANQLTVGLSSSTLALDSGLEALNLSLGQIFYFADRKVQLSGEPEDRSRSPYAAELTARPHRFLTASASLEWDPDTDPGVKEWRRRVVGLGYNDDVGRTLSAVYRSSGSSYETTRLSFSTPLGPRIDLIGDWLYSLKDKETSESMLGVSYGQCCWRIHASARQIKRYANEDPELAWILQLELRGLGVIGN